MNNYRTTGEQPSNQAEQLTTDSSSNSNARQYHTNARKVAVELLLGANQFQQSEVSNCQLTARYPGCTLVWIASHLWPCLQCHSRVWACLAHHATKSSRQQPPRQGHHQFPENPNNPWYFANLWQYEMAVHVAVALAALRQPIDDTANSPPAVSPPNQKWPSPSPRLSKNWDLKLKNGKIWKSVLKYNSRHIIPIYLSMLFLYDCKVFAVNGLCQVCLLGTMTMNLRSLGNKARWSESTI